MAIKFRLVLLSLFCLLFNTISGAAISPGSSLYASNLNQTWSSPDSTFSLGFIPTDPPTSPPSFIAAITYSGGVPIWSAGYEIRVDSGGALHFLSSGTLQLVNSSGDTVWDSDTASRGVSSAHLDETGNLILRNGTASVWSSFDNPTDTILPSQNFTVGKVLRSGMYSFQLLKNGNLTLLWNNSILYWNQGLNSSVTTNLTSPSLILKSIGILTISDPKLATAAIFAYSNDDAEAGDILRFLKLESDGNVRIYSSTKGSGTKIERWAAVTDQCQVFGYCGNMGICSYNDSNPICGCASLNFEPVDPKDSRQGCKRKMEIEDCPQSMTMLDLDHTRFLTYPPETDSQIFLLGISACKVNCLVNSACDASTSLADGTGQCYYKTAGYLSGYDSPAMTSSSYIKVCGPVVPNPPSSLERECKKKVWKMKAWILVLVVVASLLGLTAVEGGLWWWFCRKSHSFGSLSAQYALYEYASGAPVQFSYKEIERSTKKFKEKLGAGGFGAVYKGILANRTVVAVKRLEGIEQGEKQFKMEVATISSTHHLNLVRLIGFCSEGRHRLLVYEFMKNGSLDDYLFAPEEQSGKFLSWENRFKIALGTARGITYLHEECRDCIVHCDIKPENILLDESYNSKVSDFGLAKLLNPKDLRYLSLTSVRGTRGYLAPEWLANLPITSKSDVYSYGMVLLETVSGRRNFEVSEETDRKKFSIWAFEEFEKGNIKGILDKKIADCVDMDQVTRAIQVSFCSSTASSAPATSSSFQISGVWPSAPARNMEKATASLIQLYLS
ncbi:hypothetical protein M0R45_009163 [Rubus argutus]|uniref:Receptor-like serine/threonine-protein kinase n=1 Tax=Rubus argutus TaxID=59490 RepID=A0AAW1Y5S0_RUBAR